MNKIKIALSIVFVLNVVPGISQEDDSEYHRVYFSVHGGAYHASKKTVSYYDGQGENNIARLISIPQIYSQIFNKIGYDFVIGSYPYEPRYRIGTSLGADIGIWLSEYSALNIGVSYVNLRIKEAFTLEADDPANLNGDPLVFTQQILGTEQRFNIDIGLHNDVGANEKYMTYFEWGGNFSALKPVKHEIIIEESLRYNIMHQPGFYTVAPRTELGYGGYIGFGCRIAFPKNMALDFGGKFYIQKLKLHDKQGFMPSQLIYLRFVYL